MSKEVSEVPEEEETHPAKVGEQSDPYWWTAFHRHDFRLIDLSKMEGREHRLPRSTRVKDKQPAERQITAEQILRTAKELQLEDDVRPPKQLISAPGELKTYKLRMRREFEDMIRRVGRFNVSCWFK